MKSPKSILAKINQSISTIIKINEYFDEIKINQGIILSNLNQNKTSKKLIDYEFKVFSQWGEDGIIQHLTKILDIKNKTFIEFGVENFLESNCRFLLMKDNWKGFVIDGSLKNIERIRRSYFCWKHHLNSLNVFITKDNINNTLSKSGFDEDLGILSIDLDGNDYYILEAIDSFRPRILICEYNSVFGGIRKISVPYAPEFQRTNKHYSNLYWGASLAAMSYLAEKKGYALVGTNSAGNNAFYVSKYFINDELEVLSVNAAYVASHYRESRDKHGNLTYLDGDKRLDAIRGLPVFEVEKQIVESI